MKSICFFWLLSSINFSVVAQRYWTKPYLLIENTISAKQYKIKPESQILLKTVSDSVVRQVWFMGFASDSSIYIFDKKDVLLSEIDFISIKPEQLRRTTRQILLTTGTIIFVSSFIAYSYPSFPNQGGYFLSAILTPPITILGTPMASSIVYKLTPWYSFQKGKNLSIKIIN